MRSKVASVHLSFLEKWIEKSKWKLSSCLCFFVTFWSFQKNAFPWHGVTLYSALFLSAAVARLEMATALLGRIEAKNIFKNIKNEKLFLLPNGYLEDGFWFFSKPYFSWPSVCPCVLLWVSACPGGAWLAMAVPLTSGCPGNCCDERCPTLLGQTACTSALKILRVSHVVLLSRDCSDYLLLLFLKDCFQIS